MEPKYIVAIVALSLFFLLFLIFFVLLARRRKMEAKLQAWLSEVYSDKNLLKVDYDSASDEDEVVRASENRETVSEVEQTAESNEEKEEPTTSDEPYEKLEVEGIEEITGNYEPEK